MHAVNDTHAVELNNYCIPEALQICECALATIFKLPAVRLFASLPAVQLVAS